MGLLRSIWNAISGPLIVVAVLAAHLGYRLALEEPVALALDKWPSSVKESEKAVITKEQKAIVEELKKVFNNKGTADFIESRLTDDAEFEDMLTKFEGKEELRRVFGHLVPRFIKSIDFDVRQLHHAPNEVVVDWTMKTDLGYASFDLPMYTHIFTQSTSKSGGGLRVKRIAEEWYNKAQINEQTTIPIVGRFQQKWRRFNGYLTDKMVQNNIL